MSCNYCWPGNCCGGPNCLSKKPSAAPDIEAVLARVRDADWDNEATISLSDRDALLRHVATLTRERDEARAEAERQTLRLATCGVVANANTETSAVHAREMHPDYYSASVADVARAVDREMTLRAEVARLREALEPFAKEAASLDYPDVPDDHALFMSSITMGDLRRARDALRDPGEKERT